MQRAGEGTAAELRLCFRARTPFCCLRPGEVPEEGPQELWLPPLSLSLLCRCPCSNIWMSSSCRSLSARFAMPLQEGTRYVQLS